VPQKVLVVGEGASVRNSEPKRPVRGLARIAVSTGLVFAMASALDLVLGLALVEWGNPVARFTALTSAGAALPMLAVGVVLLSTVAMVTGSRRGMTVMMFVVGILCLLISGALVFASGAYGETRAVAPETARGTVRDALVRLWVFGGSFLLAFGVVMVVLRQAVAVPRTD
jgi:hypothetical protein